MLNGSEPDDNEALLNDWAKYFTFWLNNEKRSSDSALGDAEDYLDISETSRSANSWKR